MEVPIVMIILPGSVTPIAGTETCASTFPTATAKPSFNPVNFAISFVSSPALVPKGTTSPRSLVSVKFSKRGSRALKNSLLGYPSCLCQIDLYPAVQLFLTSDPVNREITQSVASTKRSAFSYISSASLRICHDLAIIHSDLILPPYLDRNFSPLCSATSFILLASSCAA